MNRKMLLTLTCVIGMAGWVGVERASDQAQDEAAIRGSIENYINSFYLTDPELLNDAVHPNLKKRDIRDVNGTEYLNEMTRSQLKAIAAVANRGGQWTSESKKEIEIFDTQLGISSAKLTVDGWIDYFHLAEINGEWKIVNVLWAEFPADTED